jgi:hypothetical protein
VDTLLELASQRHPPSAEEEVSKAQAEDVVYVFSHPLSFRGHTLFLLLFTPDACHDRSDARILNSTSHDRYRMFEPNMDEYLDEEIDSLKQTFEQTCRDWEKKVLFNPPRPFVPSLLSSS